jgi:hypothetical protein
MSSIYSELRDERRLKFDFFNTHTMIVVPLFPAQGLGSGVYPAFEGTRTPSAYAAL